jgi:endoglucanase
VASGCTTPQTDHSLPALGRGINFGNMLESPREGDWGRKVEDSDIDRVAAAGFDTIRLPVRFSNHADMAPPYRLDPVFLARIDHIVDRALADHLNIILDQHNYSQLTGDPLDAHEAAVDPALVEDRMIALWSQIAGHFHGRPKSVLFELMNEPHKDMTAERWNRLMPRILKAVRAKEPDRAVIVGPTDWNNAKDLAKLDLPEDPALIVTIHNYEPFDFTHQGAKWVEHTPPLGKTCCDEKQIARLTAPLDIAVAWGKEHHVPIYLGEFGAYNRADLDSRVNFTRAMRQAAEDRGLSWAYWEYNAGFGLYNPKAGQWVEPLKEALLPR